MDEPLHVAGGYIFLARGMEGLWYLPRHMHPPALNVLQAVLIYTANPNIPLEALNGWGRNFLVFTDSLIPYLLPIERTEVLSRTPGMLLTVILGALIFRWGKELGKTGAGLLALGLLTFDPLILAHGRLAHTDAGVTLFGTAALYAGWHWYRRPSWRWSLGAGILLGLTLLSKFSGILWLAAWGLIVLWVIMQNRQNRIGRLLQALTAGTLAWLIFWAVFGFSIGNISSLPIPMPAPAYWEAALAQQATIDERIFIAFGRLWQGPHWWYFPLNFLIKNPLPFLIMVALGGWEFVRHREKRKGPFALIVFPLLYAFVAITMGPNISYRHMLPAHPFLYLIAAAGLIGIWRRVKHKNRLPLCLLGGVLGVWYIFGTLRFFPDELAYFNELVGGPKGGHRYLVDYTQDWGQAYKALRSYVETHPGPEPQIFVFTHVHPDHYSTRYRRLESLTPFHPQPGRYVLGPAPLYGLTGPGQMVFDWFHHTRPTAMVGHSLFVYDVKEQPEWIAQCTIPVTPMDDAAIREGFGQADLRRADFECTTAWLYPGGATQMGVYVLHHERLPLREKCLIPSLPDCAPLPSDAFIQRRLQPLWLSYEQRGPGRLPAFVAYELSPDIWFPVPPASSVQVSPAGIPSPQGAQTLATPIALKGPLTFLGAAAFPDKDGLDVETWWQATEGPITRPLSIMGHLLNAGGELLGQSDGLGVSPVIWMPGDIIVQRHRFLRPSDGAELWLRTGVYWLDTMERWPVSHAPDTDTILVPLDK